VARHGAPRVNGSRAVRLQIDQRHEISTVNSSAGQAMQKILVDLGRARRRWPIGQVTAVKLGMNLRAGRHIVEIDVDLGLVCSSRDNSRRHGVIADLS
jgi:hypothetical protein